MSSIKTALATVLTQPFSCTQEIESSDITASSTINVEDTSRVCVRALPNRHYHHHHHHSSTSSSINDLARMSAPTLMDHSQPPAVNPRTTCSNHPNMADWQLHINDSNAIHRNHHSMISNNADNLNVLSLRLRELQSDYVNGYKSADERVNAKIDQLQNEMHRNDKLVRDLLCKSRDVSSLGKYVEDLRAAFDKHVCKENETVDQLIQKFQTYTQRILTEINDQRRPGAQELTNLERKFEESARQFQGRLSDLMGKLQRLNDLFAHHQEHIETMIAKAVSNTLGEVDRKDQQLMGRIHQNSSDIRRLENEVKNHQLHNGVIQQIEQLKATIAHSREHFASMTEQINRATMTAEHALEHASANQEFLKKLQEEFRELNHKFDQQAHTTAGHKSRLDGHAERLNESDNRLDVFSAFMETRLSEHKQFLDAHDDTIETHRRIVDGHANEIDNHKEYLTKHQSEIASNSTRVTGVENKLDQWLLGNGLQEQIDDINSRLNIMARCINQVAVPAV